MFGMCCQMHIALLRVFFNRLKSTTFSYPTNTRKPQFIKPLTIWWHFIIFIHFYLLLVGSFFIYLFILYMSSFVGVLLIFFACSFFSPVEILIFFIVMICNCSLYKAIKMLLYLLQIFSSYITSLFIFYVVFLPYNV